MSKEEIGPQKKSILDEEKMYLDTISNLPKIEHPLISNDLNFLQIMTIFSLLLINVPVQASLVIQKLENQQGFTIINLGHTELVEDTKTIVHLIRRNHIRELISIIEEDIGNEESSPWIKNKIKSLKNKAEILIVHRKKRGLLNLVGRASKFLFGTMDDRDQKDINEHIENLENNNRNLINEYNQQIKINDYFNETIKLFLQTNSINQNKITRSFNNLSEEVKQLIHSQRILDLSLKLQIVDERINQILDSIASIKAGILHPGILTTEEISDYNITIEKLQNARTCILEKDNDKLLIGIKIPTKYKQIPYKLLIPLPNKNFEEIAESPQIFTEIENTKYEIGNKVSYKNELKVLKTCLDTSCPMRTNNKEDIVKLNDNVILAVNQKYPKIRNFCDERKLEISGNYMFNIKNCTLIINDRNYTNLCKEYENNEIFEMFNIQWKDINVTLDNVTIGNVSNLKRIQDFESHKTLTFSIQGTMFVILFLIIGVLIRNNCKGKTYIVSNKNLEYLHQESKNQLNGGGVTLQTPPPSENKRFPSFSLNSQS